MKSRLFLQLLCLVAAIYCQNLEDVDLDAAGDTTSGFSSTSLSSITTPSAGGSSDITGTPPTAQTGGSSTNAADVTQQTDSTLSPGSTTLFTGTTTTGETQAPTTAGTGTTEAPGSTATAAPTTAAPPPTIPMDSFTMPNNLTPMNAKVVYQEALALANHIQALLDEITTLQDETSPDSPLISEMYDMSDNATQMMTTLDSLTSQLDVANANLTAAITNYNSVSYTYNCIASYLGVTYTTAGPTTLGTTTEPTTTVAPPYTCDKNLTANGTDQTVTFYGNGTKCSYTVSTVAGSGTIKYNLTLTVSGGASVAVVDVISGATLANYTDSGNNAATTNTTVLRFDANDAAHVQYNLTYSSYDPCDGFGCDASCSQCGLNSLGQPFCKLSPTASPCASLQSDGKTCQTVNPCIFRGKDKCLSEANTHCVNSTTDCTASCQPNSPGTLPRFVRLDRREEESGLRGLLHRWVF